MMLCEVASWCKHKKHGKTPVDAMLDMYEKYGYYREGLETKTLAESTAQIQSMMRKATARIRRRSWAVIRHWQYATTRRTH